ncbi:MAG: hypothetical protein JW839_19355 [Candidatus Lokiarchaeota archaeon]|nr:hypothetical protein [Candidatus Lokiarchaeota archaeon]
MARDANGEPIWEPQAIGFFVDYNMNGRFDTHWSLYTEDAPFGDRFYATYWLSNAVDFAYIRGLAYDDAWDAYLDSTWRDPAWLINLVIDTVVTILIMVASVYSGGAALALSLVWAMASTFVHDAINNAFHGTPPETWEWMRIDYPAEGKTPYPHLLTQVWGGGVLGVPTYTVLAIPRMAFEMWDVAGRDVTYWWEQATPTWEGLKDIYEDLGIYTQVHARQSGWLETFPWFGIFTFAEAFDADDVITATGVTPQYLRHASHGWFRNREVGIVAGTFAAWEGTAYTVIPYVDERGLIGYIGMAGYPEDIPNMLHAGLPGFMREAHGHFPSEPGHGFNLDSPWRLPEWDYARADMPLPVPAGYVADYHVLCLSSAYETGFKEVSDYDPGMQILDWTVMIAQIVISVIATKGANLGAIVQCLIEELITEQIATWIPELVYDWIVQDVIGAEQDYWNTVVVTEEGRRVTQYNWGLQLLDNLIRGVIDQLGEFGGDKIGDVSFSININGKSRKIGIDAVMGEVQQWQRERALQTMTRSHPELFAEFDTDVAINERLAKQKAKLEAQITQYKYEVETKHKVDELRREFMRNYDKGHLSALAWRMQASRAWKASTLNALVSSIGNVLEFDDNIAAIGAVADFFKLKLQETGTLQHEGLMVELRDYLQNDATDADGNPILPQGKTIKLVVLFKDSTEHITLDDLESIDLWAFLTNPNVANLKIVDPLVAPIIGGPGIYKGTLYPGQTLLPTTNPNQNLGAAGFPSIHHTTEGTPVSGFEHEVEAAYNEEFEEHFIKETLFGPATTMDSAMAAKADQAVEKLAEMRKYYRIPLGQIRDVVNQLRRDRIITFATDGTFTIDTVKLDGYILTDQLEAKLTRHGGTVEINGMYRITSLADIRDDGRLGTDGKPCMSLRVLLWRMGINLIDRGGGNYRFDVMSPMQWKKDMDETSRTFGKMVFSGSSLMSKRFDTYALWVQPVIGDAYIKDLKEIRMQLDPGIKENEFRGLLQRYFEDEIASKQLFTRSMAMNPALLSLDAVYKMVQSQAPTDKMKGAVLEVLEASKPGTKDLGTGIDLATGRTYHEFETVVPNWAMEALGLGDPAKRDPSITHGDEIRIKYRRIGSTVKVVGFTGIDFKAYTRSSVEYQYTELTRTMAMLLAGIIGIQNFPGDAFAADGVRIDLSMVFPSDADLSSALNQFDEHLLNPALSDQYRTFGYTRRVFQANTFTPAGDGTPVKTIVLKPHSGSDIFVEFGFQQVGVAGSHSFNVFSRVGRVHLNPDTGKPTLVVAPDIYNVDWRRSDGMLFDNFPAGTFAGPGLLAPEEHAPGPQTTPAGKPHQVTLSYSQSTGSTRDLLGIAQAFYRSLRPDQRGTSATFKNPTPLGDISRQLDLYFAKVDHSYPRAMKPSNVREFLHEQARDRKAAIFTPQTQQLEGGFPASKSDLKFQRSIKLDRDISVYIDKGFRDPTKAELDCIRKQWEDGRKQIDSLVDSARGAMEGFLGVRLFKALGILQGAGNLAGGQTLVTWLDGANLARETGHPLPAGSEYEYLQPVINNAVKRYAQRNGLAYATDAQIQEANKKFVQDLLWHANDGSVPTVPGTSQQAILPVLGEAMVLLLVEGVRQAIEEATGVQTILGMEFSPATLRYKMEALDRLGALEGTLLGLMVAGNKMRAGDAHPGLNANPAIADQEGFIIHAKGTLAKAVLSAMQEPLKALFEHLPDGAGDIFATDCFDRQASDAAITAFASERLPNILLNSLPKGGMGTATTFLYLERLLQAVMKTGYTRSLEMLLGANGLEQVGERWTGPDGYEYFEVSDGKGERMLCRAYKGEMGVLYEGIEVFLDARTEGEVPDPDYPATATGFLHTVNKGQYNEIEGLQDVVDAATTQEGKMNAYRQWLASHARLKTKFLDEFYTHYAYPTS